MTNPPRMTDQDIATIRAWLLGDTLMEPAVRQGFAALLAEVELARKNEAELRRQLAEIARDEDEKDWAALRALGSIPTQPRPKDRP